MDNQDLISKLASLPEPDFLHSSQLSDPLGSNTSYRASTVVKLIEQATEAERRRCAAIARREQMDAVECGNRDAEDTARRIADDIEA